MDRSLFPNITFKLTYEIEFHLHALGEGWWLGGYVLVRGGELCHSLSLPFLFSALIPI